MKHLTLLCALALPVLVMSACEQSTTGPDQKSALSIVSVPEPALEIVTLCKNFSGERPDSFTFRGENTSPELGNPFRVARNTCRRIALKGDEPITVQVREIDIPAGVRLDSIVVQQRIGNTTTRTKLGPEATATATVGGNAGATIVFFDSSQPEPPFDCRNATPILEVGIVCKFYNGDRATNFTFRGENTNLVGSPFTVAKNTSRRVTLKGDDSIRVTVTEIDIPEGIKLDSVVVFQRFGNTTTRTNLGKVTTGRISVGGNSGGVIAFFDSNTETPPPGRQGCSPGFWKNHPDAWAGTGFSTGQTVTSVFSQAAAFPAGSLTLIQALGGGGGPGVNGGARILARSAVAALLNSASPDVNFPRTTAQVISSVNAAFASNNRTVMLNLSEQLDKDNNLGCPLN